MSKLVWFDLESTSADPYTARICEFAFAGPMAGAFVERVNPGMPIPADATAVHGISDADVAVCPPFAHFAPMVQQIVDGATLCGYKCRTFDTILLDLELRRADQPGLPRDKADRIVAREIDLYEIWKRQEDRRLITAARRFAQTDLENAHTAAADMHVLPLVFAGMCAEFGLDADDQDALCHMSIPEGCIDREAKFIRREDGVVVFGFGPHKDEPVESQLGFLEWMLKRDFTPETKSIALVLHNRATRRKLGERVQEARSA